MKLPGIFLLCSCVAVFSLFADGTAEANGTLKATFVEPDGTPLDYTYLYLRDASKPSPMEQFFTPADYVIGPFSNGNVTASVPAGRYNVRLTRRAQVGGGTKPYGPPEGDDYTWSPHSSIAITDGAITQLGTQYAGRIGAAIVITGTARDLISNKPLTGKYVRAQTEECIEGDYSSSAMSEWVDPNYCGPDKFLALEKTDANGKFTLVLRDPGTYYIIVSRELYGHDKWQQYSGNPRVTGWQVGPITVALDDEVTLPDMKIPVAFQ